MPSVKVENLVFTFESAIEAQKYDGWTHYTQVWNKPPASQKAVDVVAVETAAVPAITWLIEAKDFRIVNPASPPKPSNLTGLPQTVADKVAHTIAGLGDAAGNAANASEKNLAVKALAAAKKRIVLHLEPYNGSHTRLFPAGFAANVLQTMRGIASVRAIDPNPLVLNISNTAATGVPWTAA